VSTEDFDNNNGAGNSSEPTAPASASTPANTGGTRPVVSGGTSRPFNSNGGGYRGSNPSNLGNRGFRPAGSYGGQNNSDSGDSNEGGNQGSYGGGQSSYGGGGGFGGAGGRPQQRRPRRPGGKDRFSQRRRVCQFCVDKIRLVDYKDFQRLRRYLSDRGKIEPRRKTGTCARHQRSLTTALKRGRYMALLPYVSAHTR